LADLSKMVDMSHSPVLSMFKYLSYLIEKKSKILKTTINFAESFYHRFFT